MLLKYARKSALLLLSACLISPVAVQAKTLATSQKYKMEIMAEGDSGWCSDKLSLQAKLQGDSPLVGDSALLGNMLSRMKTPIQNDCPKASSAVIKVLVNGVEKERFAGSSANGWVFSVQPKTSAPSVPAPTPASAPQPVAASSAQQQSPAATAVPVAQATPQEAPAAVDTAEQTPTAYPAAVVGEGYKGILVRVIRAKPALLDNKGLVRWWTAMHFPNEYRKVANQEFELAPLIDSGKKSLQQAVGEWDPHLVSLDYGVRFGEYDFDRSIFPMDLSDEVTLSVQRPDYHWNRVQGFTRVFRLSLEGMNYITGMPMTREAAKQFVAQRTNRYGDVDRDVVMRLFIRLPDDAALPDGVESYANIENAQIEYVEFYSGRKAPEKVASISQDIIAKQRAEVLAAREAAEKERKRREAEEEMKQLMARREQDIAVLGKVSVSARLFNFISPSTELERGSLTSLRKARGYALLHEKPVTVSMLVQSDGGGATDVPTKWPGLLNVTIPQDAKPMESLRWYLVYGDLIVPQGEGLPDAILRATEVYECQAEQCADASAPEAVVDRKVQQSMKLLGVER